jgi:hypothetical protein
VPDIDPTAAELLVSIEDAVVDRFQRCTLPFSDARGGTPGTAFRCGRLLITASAVVQYQIGAIELRPDLIEPRGAASDQLLMRDFSAQWTHDAASGAAFMDTAGLEAHAAGKGWAWAMQLVTDATAARSDDVAEVADRRVAFVLGHGVDGSSRPLVLIRGAVGATPDGAVRWLEPVRDGLAGSPVFTVKPLSEGMKVICLGSLRPDTVVATFDLIRAAAPLM